MLHYAWQKGARRVGVGKSPYPLTGRNNDAAKPGATRLRWYLTNDAAHRLHPRGAASRPAADFR